MNQRTLVVLYLSKRSLSTWSYSDFDVFSKVRKLVATKPADKPSNANAKVATSHDFSVHQWMHRDDDAHNDFLGVDLTKTFEDKDFYVSGPVQSQSPSNLINIRQKLNQLMDVVKKASTSTAVGQPLDTEFLHFDYLRPWQDDDFVVADKQTLNTSNATNAKMVEKEKKVFSHVTSSGRATMVDVGFKPVTFRCAVAEGSVIVSDEIMLLLQENQIKKGDVLTVAQVAGIMGAKKTADLIPLCHNIALSDVQVLLTLDPNRRAVCIRSEIKCDGKTGAEMEALTAVCLAALTVYDMCKAVSKDISISNVHLVSKSGGKSDYHLGWTSSVAYIED